jgi:hypothetical protein
VSESLHHLAIELIADSNPPVEALFMRAGSASAIGPLKGSGKTSLSWVC